MHCFSAGEGKFGKVYECLNLDTGEINAVKQVLTLHKCSVMNAQSANLQFQ